MLANALVALMAATCLASNTGDDTHKIISQASEPHQRNTASDPADYIRSIPFVCGNDACEGTHLPYGETCGNCPVDCGPCQIMDDLSTCVDNDAFSITIDDGPTNYTAHLLALLDVLGVKASFFIIGQRINAFPDVFELQRRQGHAQVIPTII